MSGTPYPTDPQYGRRAIKTDQLPRLPRVKLVSSAAQTTTSGAFYSPTLDSVTYDTHGFKTASATPQITIAVAGLYLVRLRAQFVTTAAFGASFDLWVNGATVIEENHIRAAQSLGAQDLTLVATWPLNRGNTVGMRVMQNSGSSLTLAAGSTSLELAWLGNL